MFEKIISEICKEENIKQEIFCDGYCLKLCKDNHFTFIYNNLLENNSSAVFKILRDKSAVFEILSKYNIDCVEHFYFHENEREKFNKTAGNLLKIHKKIVLKQNDGMSGNFVYLIENSTDLTNKSNEIFEKFQSISVSPFYEIKHEYRVVILNNKVELIFDKIRPFVVGDGKNTIEKLAKNKYKFYKIDENIDTSLVLEAGESLTLSWRHNLNFGSIPEIVTDKKLLSGLSDLSKNIAKLLKIKFACIDIIETQGKLKVLEINSSVTMGKFASFSEENYNIAKNIYKKAILNNLK